LLRLLVEKALQEGIIVIAAVPGQNQSGGFPANVPGVIAVGQGSESKNGQIIAPGRDILTTVPQQGYDFMTGSSFATPHVVGIAALLLQVHPDWRSADIKRLLESHDFLVSNNLLDLVKPYSSTKNQ
jgi:subtilisin family serine protease